MPDGAISIPSAKLPREYWWVVASFQGRTVIIGPKETEEDANRFGYGQLECPFNVVMMPTRDKARASAMLKARKLEKEGNLGGALERMMHKPPNEYKKPWWGLHKG